MALLSLMLMLMLASLVRTRLKVALVTCLLDGVLSVRQRNDTNRKTDRQTDRQTNRQTDGDLVFLFKCIKGICDIDVFSYVSLRSCSRPLRDIDHLTLQVPFSRTEAFRNSYFIRVTRLWNNLPLRIRELEALSLFRSKLIKYYSQKFQDNVDI